MNNAEHWHVTSLDKDVAGDYVLWTEIVMVAQLSLLMHRGAKRVQIEVCSNEECRDAR